MPNKGSSPLYRGVGSVQRLAKKYQSMFKLSWTTALERARAALPGPPFIIKIDTGIETGDFTMSFPETTNTVGTTLKYDCVVDWGDGTSDRITAYDQAEITHTYAVAGVYIITTTGVMQSFNIYNGDYDNEHWLIEIMQWGRTDLIELEYAYYGFPALATISATDVPDLGNLETPSLEEVFDACPLTTCDLSNWDTSSITSMVSAFYDCAAAVTFGVASWDVSSVTHMDWMFTNATLFNEDIGGWNTVSLNAVDNMFQDAAAFNQDISGWDVSAGLTASSFLTGALAFSTANYDLLLNAWSLLTFADTGNSIDVDNTSYTIVTSQAARDILTSAPNNFGITDAGGI